MKRLFLILLISFFITNLTTVALARRPVSNQPPTALPGADPTSGIVPLEVQFTGDGTDTDGYIVAYHWDFGDGSISDLQNPIHAYEYSNTYDAILTVTDGGGATGSAPITITVNKPQIPKKIRFQGILKDSYGDVVDEPLGITVVFNIYDVDRTFDTDPIGTSLWTETQNLKLEEGKLDVVLGNNQALDLPFNKPYYLGVKVGQDEEMVPRFEVTTVPYAFTSER